MLKLPCALILMFLSSFCMAQQQVKTNLSRAYTGTLLTQIVVSGDKQHYTSRLLYIVNEAGDSFVVYKIQNNVVEDAMAYHIVIAKNKSWLIAEAINTNQQSADSLTINFDDQSQCVFVNKDKYLLYPTYFKELKQAVLLKHSVMAVMGFLQDRIGDYPIEQALPLMLFTPETATGKQIKQATVTTARSQSDEITDTWNCVYRYNQAGKLAAIKASVDKYIYFTKSMIYYGDKVAAIKSYRNIESRQITHKLLSYPAGNTALIKWREDVLETGKNRESNFSVTLRKKALGGITRLIMPSTEVLYLIKQITSPK